MIKSFFNTNNIEYLEDISLKKYNTYHIDTTCKYLIFPKDKEELIKITTKNNKTFWVCTLCRYIYDGEDLPENFVCPKCKQGKEKFIRK